MGEVNMTLATSWIGQQFACLAFTIEMPFKDNADLPDPQVGWNGERSKRLGRQRAATRAGLGSG
jgi:murein tripeptide amidase MpaA